MLSGSSSHAELIPEAADTGDLYVEKLPQDVKFLKLLVRADQCREHSIASDLYLSSNIVRFNQTIHFSVGEEENVVNELEVSLLYAASDGSVKFLGNCKLICTHGEHSVTRTVSLNDTRGVMIGKVPITSFYYTSAIKLGDRVMFKPSYEPNAKEYAFLLSRRIRQPSKATPVTFDRTIEHKLNNDARDLIGSSDFKIVSLDKKKKPITPELKKPAKIASSAADSLTYNPGMTRNGAMSDAVRGRVVRKKTLPLSSKSAKKQTKPEPPKLRETYMSVGYVRDKKWPERTTGQVERNLYRLQQAGEMKLQILKDIAMTVKQKNLKTEARQAAIRKKKEQVELKEAKIKKVLLRRESEIQLLKGTLAHLRLTTALRDSGVATKICTPSKKGFSRLNHLLYPNDHDSTDRSLITRSILRNHHSSGSRTSPTCDLHRSLSGRIKKTGVRPCTKKAQSVSFSAPSSLRRRSSPAKLYQPLADQRNAPYDSRKRQLKSATSRHSEELVDQLSDVFNMTFEEPHEKEKAHAATDTCETIAKDWLATARASIDQFHRPQPTQLKSTAQSYSFSTTKLSTTTSNNACVMATEQNKGGESVSVPVSEKLRAQAGQVFYPEDEASNSTSSEGSERYDSRVPNFLNSLVQQSDPLDADKTVSSIAVGDIPFFPTEVGSGNSTKSDEYADADSLDPLHDDVPAGRQRSRKEEENIKYLRLTSTKNAGLNLKDNSSTLDSSAKHNFVVEQRKDGSSRYTSYRGGRSRRSVAEQLERNRQYSQKNDHSSETFVPLHREAQESEIKKINIEENGGALADRCEEIESSLSETLKRDVSEVSDTVHQLQNRVSSMRSMNEQQRIPTGWKEAASLNRNKTKHDGKIENSLPTPQAGLLWALQSAVGNPKKPVLVDEREKYPSDSSAKNDIRIVFEEASSSSGEFDLLMHKAAISKRK